MAPQPTSAPAAGIPGHLLLRWCLRAAVVGLFVGIVAASAALNAG